MWWPRNRKKKVLILNGKIACFGKDAPEKFQGEVYIIKNWFKFNDESTLEELPERPHILVAAFAEAGLMKNFGKNVLAVITHAGGILNHFWIISRETLEGGAVPHLVGITNVHRAHKKLKNGDIIDIEIVDRETAKITRISTSQ